jgi:hypothetical protein
MMKKANSMVWMVLLMTASSVTVAEEAGHSKHGQWAYRVLSLPSLLAYTTENDSTKSERKSKEAKITGSLNALGQDGWELVVVTPEIGWVFKRPIASVKATKRLSAIPHKVSKAQDEKMFLLYTFDATPVLMVATTMSTLLGVDVKISGSNNTRVTGKAARSATKIEGWKELVALLESAGNTVSLHKNGVQITEAKN